MKLLKPLQGLDPRLGEVERNFFLERGKTHSFLTRFTLEITRPKLKASIYAFITIAWHPNRIGLTESFIPGFWKS